MALQRVAGVHRADVSYEAGRATVAYDPAVTSPAEFIKELERMTGFTAEVEAAEDNAESESMHEHETSGNVP